MIVLRQKNQMPTRNANLGGQPGALGSDRIFDDLHHQGLALKNLLFNGHQRLRTARYLGRLTFGLAMPHIGHMQKSGTLKADVNEGRLHARQDTRHLAQIDIAHQAPL